MTTDNTDGDAAGLPPRSFGDNAKEVQFGDMDHSHIPFEEEEWPVVIIGSSMVGMMTGLILGYHGYFAVQDYWSNSVLISAGSKAFHSTATHHPALIPEQLA